MRVNLSFVNKEVVNFVLCIHVSSYVHETVLKYDIVLCE